MEKQWLWYLSGSMDTALMITARLQEDDRLTMGYTINPMLSYSRPTEVESVFGMVDEYCEERNVKYRIDNQKSSNRLLIEEEEDARRFLEPLVPGFVQQRKRAEVFLNEFLPLFEEGRPQTKEQFIEAVEVLDELRKHPITGRSTKYNAQHFKEKWDLE